MKIFLCIHPVLVQGTQLTNTGNRIYMGFPVRQSSALPWHSQQYQLGEIASSLWISDSSVIFNEVQGATAKVCFVPHMQRIARRSDFLFLLMLMTVWRGQKMPQLAVSLTEIGDSGPGCGSPCSQATPIAKPPFPPKQCPSDPGVLVQD